MKPLTLILGVLLILLLFGIGETFIKRVRIKKIQLVCCLILLLFSLLLPAYNLGQLTFTISGFGIFLIISVLFLSEIKNKTFRIKFFISYLITVFFMQIFFIIDWTKFDIPQEILWIIMFALLSFIILKICIYPKQSFASLFLGINTAQIIHGLTSDGYIFLGGDIVLLALIISAIFMIIIYNINFLLTRRNKIKALMFQPSQNNKNN